ncbi:RlpA-like double-psi beta-barrel-protein domain-containing protein-containing protein [Gautieria morchelliformis]|nr:RlpA-like double-psi beta-barrel-protein domain-containing protein-containing protein [Gautieria morchelliformis]KAF8470354.1 RlpA-like double-psi beta-barrel-protein domain-containing protein-containing protein [Gautieria morchelliformis]
MFQYVILVLLALFSTLAYAAPVFQPHSGDATFFRPAVGACGDTNTVSDLVVAVSFEFFHSFGPQTNGNPICDRRIQATAPGGKTVTVTVKDKCAACAHFDLDMSPAAFDQLADRSVGRIHAVKWHLL